MYSIILLQYNRPVAGGAQQPEARGDKFALFRFLLFTIQ